MKKRMPCYGLLAALLATGCNESSPTPRVTPASEDTKASPSGQVQEPQAGKAQQPEDACDISTAEKAIEVFSRFKEPSFAVSPQCVIAIPELQVALGGMGGSGGCPGYSQILFRCRQYRLSEASMIVLPALGWKEAPVEERERLASLWVQRVLLAGHEELKPQETHPEKSGGIIGMQAVFPTPEVKTLPDGSVRFDTWRRSARVQGGEPRYRRELFTFAPDAAVTFEELESYELGQKGPQSWEERPLVRLLAKASSAEHGGRMNEFARVLQSSVLEVCYPPAVRRNPAIMGSVKLQISRDARGKVAVRTEEPNPVLASSGLMTCVEKTFRKTDYPEVPDDVTARILLSISSIYVPPPLLSLKGDQPLTPP